MVTWKDYWSVVKNGFQKLGNDITGVTQAQITADATKSSADLQYEAAMQQIAATIQANKDQQDYNKQEAELAFERNSSLGQLKQLMAAGLSEQQARQIIAGGSAGSYTAAPSVNEMQGVDYGAPAAAQSEKIQADTFVPLAQAEIVNSSMIGQVYKLFHSSKLIDAGLNIGANVLGTSMSASDGGIIGNCSTASLQGQILRNINDLSTEAIGSWDGFCSFASSASAPAWMKTADFQNNLQKAFSSPMALKSMRSFFDRKNELLTGRLYWQNDLLENKMKAAANKIASFKVDQEQFRTDLQRIQLDYDIAILPDRYAAMMTTYQEEAAHMAQDRNLWENKEYQKAYIRQKLASTEDAAILCEVMKLKHQGMFDHMNNNPELHNMFAIYQMWSDVGMTDSLFGQVVASIDAVGESSLGFGVGDMLKSVHQWIDNRKDDKGIF